MARTTATDRPRQVAARRGLDDGRAVATEDLHLRNYDADRAYAPTLVVTTPDGEEVLRRTYHLPPGRSRSERDRLPPGEYVVRGRLDGRHADRARCRVDDDPDATVLVELGNGVVAVSEGVR